MAVSVVEVVHNDNTSNSGVTLTLSTTPQAGDVLIVQHCSLRTTGARTVSSVSNTNVGGSWSAAYTGTRIAYWINSTATAAGGVAVSQSGAGASTTSLYLIRGLTSSTVAGTTNTGSGTSLDGTSISAGDSQIVLFAGTAMTTSSPSFPSSTTPGSGWSTAHTYSPSGSGGTNYRIPTGAETGHTVSISAGASVSMEVTGIELGTYAPAALSLTSPAAAATAAAAPATLSYGALPVTSPAASATAAAAPPTAWVIDGTITVVEVATVAGGSLGTSPSVSVTAPLILGDVLVMVIESSNDRTTSSVVGCGATWDIALTGERVQIAVGTDPTSSGSVTATLSSSANGAMQVYVVRGLSLSPTWDTDLLGDSSTTITGPTDTVTLGDIVIAALGTSGGTASAFGGTGFTSDVATTGTGAYNASHAIPASSGTYGTTATLSASFLGDIGQIALRSTPASGGLSLTSPTAAATAAALPATLALSALALTSPVAVATAASAPATLTFGTIALTSPAAAATAAAEPPVVDIGGLVLTSPAATADAAALPATLTFGTLELTSPAATATADADPATVDVVEVTDIVVDVAVGVGPVTLEAGGALPSSDAVTAPVACGVEVVARFLPRPVAPTLGVLTEWPLNRQAHIMPALSSGSPRYRADIDYTVDREEAGRRHVFVNGVDVTYIRQVPVDFDDYSSSVPFDARTCRISLPQKKPWDEMGSGDFAAFDPTNDPEVQIVLVRPDDSVEELWEGFLASEDDDTGPGQQDFTFSGEGIFSQAAHQPWNPPAFMEPTDPGWVVADALNSVVARRWSAIPRVTTGLPGTRERGKQGQSVWQYVQDILSKMWTDDERQWTLARIAPYTYRIQLKTVVTETDWTVTKGAPGIEVNLTRDQSARRDCIFGRGIDPDGGVWGNWYFPGLDKFTLPPYPMAGFANMSVGTTDGDTTTGHGVTDWQRRMREIGFPVTVDGVMNSSDTDWVKKVQRLRGITVDGSLGPQTWAATFDPGMTEMDLTAVRLPLAAKPDSEPYLYSANGAQQGPNPLFNSLRVRHAMTEVDFGPGVWKHEAFGLAEKMLARDGVVGWSGTITMLTDQHQAGASRFQIRPGHNVHVVGHAGGVDLQVSEVSVSGLSVTLTVDSRARDALTVDAILERNREARRDPSARGLGNDRASMNRSDVVQYESESQAGFVPRVAVNGNSSLWTVLPIFVSQVGVARVEFRATEPKAEMCIALFEKPITANRLASFLPDPLVDDDGWYDNVDTLKEKFGLLDIFGTPQEPAGYYPRQKTGTKAGPLTGRMDDRSGALYASQFGGFVWVAMFTSRSTWVSGRVYPAVPS